MNPPDATAAVRKPAPSHLPAGMRTVTPHLICANAAAAIDFYVKAFGATELGRMPAPDGKIMHAVIRIGDSQVMLVDEFPERGALSPTSLKGSPVTIHLYVPDTDAFIQRAAAAGAKVTLPPQDMFWGDRYGQVQDPFGHQWSVATHQYDLTSEQINEGMRDCCG